MKDRIELAEHFNELGFTLGAEIGVADGRYSKILCEKIPNLELIGVDTYAPYLGNWRDQEYQDEAYRQAKDKLKGFDVDLMKTTGVEASLTVEDGLLDFVFIDGDHYFDNAMLDIILWSKKVRKGGIVSGHDYYKSNKGTVQVMKAIDTYAEIHNIKLNIIKSKTDGHKDDRVPCWWFVKE